MWKPWVGQHYEKRKLLILGKSCYDWVDSSDDSLKSPQNDHPVMLVENQLHEPAEKNGFMLKLTRALCNQTWPSPEDRQLAWQSVAFTNYVPVSVGYGARRRPAPAAWRQAADEWPDLLEKLSPRNIIILGLSLWDNMPSPKNAAGAVGKFPQRSPAVREYVTESGNVTRCWCHWHPSAGASADSLRDVIAEAENAA